MLQNALLKTKNHRASNWANKLLKASSIELDQVANHIKMTTFIKGNGTLQVANVIQVP